MTPRVPILIKQVLSLRGIATLVAAELVFVSSAGACCANSSEYAAACAANGGTASYVGRIIQCNFPSASSSSDYSGSSGSQGRRHASHSGPTPTQQLGMQLAVTLGNAFIQALKEDDARRERARQQAAEEAMIQMKLFEEQEAKRLQELERRHQALLSSLKGGLGTTELGLKRYDSGTLELKSGSKLFGIPANPTGPLQYGGAAGGLEIKPVPPPPTPTSTALDPTKDPISAYQQAFNQASQAQADVRQLTEDQKMAQRIRQEAEQQVQAQQAKLAAIPLDQTAQRQLEDDKLAQAQKLLHQATQLDQDATQQLEQAKQKAATALEQVKQAEAEQQKVLEASPGAVHTSGSPR